MVGFFSQFLPLASVEVSFGAVVSWSRESEGNFYFNEFCSYACGLEMIWLNSATLYCISCYKLLLLVTDSRLEVMILATVDHVFICDRT